MKKRFLVYFVVLAVAVFLISLAIAPSTGDEYTSKVKSIKLFVEENGIKWSVDGYSAKGFKVVWSKNEHPTYPPRKGDKYHYFSSPEKRTDSLSAFDGPGVYYVRVCEYLGGKCGVYSNEEKIVLGKDDVEKPKKCYDSDGGKNFYKKGKVIPEGETKKVWDFCDGAVLYERFCDGKEGKTYKYTCPNGCSDGACLKVDPTDETGPVELPEKEPELCNGCYSGELCYPLGYRKDGKFCSESKEFVKQKLENDKCDNNFECKSNLCVSNSCVGQSLIQKILSWLKRFFS